MLQILPEVLMFYISPKVFCPCPEKFYIFPLYNSKASLPPNNYSTLQAISSAQNIAPQAVCMAVLDTVWAIAYLSDSIQDSRVIAKSTAWLQLQLLLVFFTDFPWLKKCFSIPYFSLSKSISELSSSRYSTFFLSWLTGCFTASRNHIFSCCI